MKIRSRRSQARFSPSSTNGTLSLVLTSETIPHVVLLLLVVGRIGEKTRERENKKTVRP